jgi:2-dehydro-3-deoxyphosphogluconate aldolase / (4S)-4-hydroxy-2-oxoglutarate aldolase
MSSPQKHGIAQLLEDQPLMALCRAMGPEESVRLATVAWESGIRVIEVTLQSPADVESLEAVSAAMKELGSAVVGAGTVTSLADVDDALSAGADFTVSPGLDLEVVRHSEKRGLPSLPGVSTPTEVHTALRAGLTWLKAFPANHLGPAWFTAIRGPFPEATFVATGGLKVADVLPMRAAGVHTVALGSALTDPQELAQLSEIVAHIRSHASEKA